MGKVVKKAQSLLFWFGNKIDKFVTPWLKISDLLGILTYVQSLKLKGNYFVTEKTANFI